MKQKRKGSIPIDILYLPALVLLTVFVIYPLISGVQISFTNWNGYSSKYKYVGLANYVKMFHDVLYRVKEYIYLWCRKYDDPDDRWSGICAAASEEIPWTDTDPRDRVSSGHDRFPDHGLYFLLSGTV